MLSPMGIGEIRPEAALCGFRADDRIEFKADVPRLSFKDSFVATR